MLLWFFVFATPGFYHYGWWQSPKKEVIMMAARRCLSTFEGWKIKTFAFFSTRGLYLLLKRLCFYNLGKQFVKCIAKQRGFGGDK